MKKAKFILTSVLVVFSLNASAGLLFNYSQLTTKDLDEMNQIVQSKIKESKQSASGKHVPLKEALQAVFSRPNDDDMIDKVIAPLRTSLDELDYWEKSISQLADEAINALKNPKAFSPVVQSTYLIFLENLLSELKPYLKRPGFERQIAERIRDAKIAVPERAANERRLRTMKSTVSPSEIARKILAEAQKAAPEKSTENLDLE